MPRDTASIADALLVKNFMDLLTPESRASFERMQRTNLEAAYESGYADGRSGKNRLHDAMKALAA